MILSKADIIANINNEISDSTDKISPFDIRHNLIDIIHSVPNFLIGTNINGLNVATPNSNVKIGNESFEKNDSLLSSNFYNTAVGYRSLRSTYQASGNTACGSIALSCNVYGFYNTALGYKSVAGNTIGHFNIGIGGYTLHNNKRGNNNLAIGHGAGYYIEAEENNKLFIAQHPVDDQYICDNPNGTGLTPLVYGDFATQQFGINVTSLHDNSSLQVSGNITPSMANNFSLGIPGYRWKYLNLSSGIYFGNDMYLGRGVASVDGIAVSGNLIPANTETYDFGSRDRGWNYAYVKNLVVTQKAVINQLQYQSVKYNTAPFLFLGTSGDDGEGMYPDEGLIGGGVILKSKGVLSGSTLYKRQYGIYYYPPSSGLQNFNGVYSQATWVSNLSFQVPPPAYIRTNHLVSHDLANHAYGLYFSNDKTFFSRKNVLENNPITSALVAGTGNINFISVSGVESDYTVSMLSVESGVKVTQRFATGVKHKHPENPNIIKGFDLSYIDNCKNNTIGFDQDRFVISSYNDTETPINTLSIMKDNEGGGICCISNMDSSLKQIPETIFNIRSHNEAVMRLTSENDEDYKSAIQLFGHTNAPASGIEIAFLKNSGIADIVLYQNYYATNFMRFNAPSGHIGILSSGLSNEAITIGHSGMANLPVISLKDSTNINQLQSSITHKSGYGKIYNMYVNSGVVGQYNSLKFLDASGNLFNLVVNKYDSIDARAIYTDINGNTFGGYLSPKNRLSQITSSISGNVTYGHTALSGIVSGTGNIAIGENTSNQLHLGNNNIVVGNKSFQRDYGYENIVIGNQAFNRSDPDVATTGNIIIGHSVGNHSTGSYNFLVGSNRKTILLHGILGPTNAQKKLTLPSGGKLYVNNDDDSSSIGFKSDTIELIDKNPSNTYPQNTLTIKFTGEKQSNNLMILNHSYAPIVKQDITYDSSNRPYLELKGDLKLQGNVCFTDGTLINTSPSGEVSDLKDRMDNVETKLLELRYPIEGYMPDGLTTPIKGSSTTGILITKNEIWEDRESVEIVNRDHTFNIPSGSYVVAIPINNEYRPIWASASNTDCNCCID